MNTPQRKRLREWVLKEFGNGICAPCSTCGFYLTIDTLTLDRFPIPGKWGGTYRHKNVRPQCQSCNGSHVGEPGTESIVIGLCHRPFLSLRNYS